MLSAMLAATKFMQTHAPAERIIHIICSSCIFRQNATFFFFSLLLQMLRRFWRVWYVLLAVAVSGKWRVESGKKHKTAVATLMHCWWSNNLAYNKIALQIINMRNSNPQTSLLTTTLKQLECSTTVTQLGYSLKASSYLFKGVSIWRQLLSTGRQRRVY